MTTAHATKFDSQAVHTRSTGPFSGQLKVESQFCPSDVADPMDTVEWETRTSQIQGEGGEAGPKFSERFEASGLSSRTV